MENIMHPKGGVDIRQLFDKFPHIIKLALSIDKAEEIATHSFFFPHGQMGLYQAAEGAVQPFRIDQRTVEPAQEVNVLSGMGIITIVMEGDNIRKRYGMFFYFRINSGLFQPAVRIVGTGSPIRPLSGAASHPPHAAR